MFSVISQAQSRLGTTTHRSATLQLELGQRRNSRTGSRQILQGRGGATGRAALGVTQKPIPWSQGMIFLMRSPLPRSRAVPQWCGSTRGQRGEDAAACKGVGRAGESIPEGSPGWAGKAAWLPHGHCSFRERDAAYPASLSAGRGGLPAPLRAHAPGGLRSFERSRCPAAPTPGPQRGGSTVPAASRGASLTQPRSPPLPPPFRVPRHSQGAPRHPLRMAAGMGRGPEAPTPRRATGKSEQLLLGASRGDAGEPRRAGGTDPATAARLPAPPPPAGRRLPWRRINTIPWDRAQREPPARRGPHPPPMGNPVPPPPAATARPPPRSNVSPDGLSWPGDARPPPSVTAPGPCDGTRRGHAPWGPPCEVPAATSAPPMQAKLHPVKLSPL